MVQKMHDRTLNSVKNYYGCSQKPKSCPLKKIRNDLNDTRYDFDGKPMQPYTNLDDANQYVDDYREWILDLTKGDEELLTLIADRRLNYQGSTIVFDNFDRWTPANQKLLKKFLDDKYDNVAPDILPIPDWIVNKQFGKRTIGFFNKASEYLWYTLGELPDSELQRIPNNTKTISAEDAKLVLKLLDKLEEDDDVQQVFHNMELTEEILKAMEE